MPKPGVNVSILVVAEIDGKLVGLASGVVWESDPSITHVYQMWVQPEARGNGIARAFLDHITEWARKKRCVSLSLDVTTTNGAAIALYESAGFSASGALEPLREGSALKTQPMARELDNAV